MLAHRSNMAEFLRELARRIDDFDLPPFAPGILDFDPYSTALSARQRSFSLRGSEGLAQCTIDTQRAVGRNLIATDVSPVFAPINPDYLLRDQFPKHGDSTARTGSRSWPCRDEKFSPNP